MQNPITNETTYCICSCGRLNRARDMLVEYTHLLKEVFIDEKIFKILKIHVNVTSCGDKLVWKATSHGRFK